MSGRKRKDGKTERNNRAIKAMLILHETIKTKPSEAARWQMAHRAYGGLYGTNH